MSGMLIKHQEKYEESNGEVYKLRKTFAMFHPVPLCFFGRGAHIV